MARKKSYKSHTFPTEISATSRISVKVNDNFYTVESSETKAVLEEDGIDMDVEWELLFNELNQITDNQVQEIINTFSNNSKN